MSRCARRELQYRDGLLLASLSFWPIRRRSIAALTVTRHLEFDGKGFNILLYPEDTKSKRAESVRVPEQLVSYVKRYLDEIRPRLRGRSHHEGLWPSLKGRPLSPGQIYVIVRARVFTKFVNIWVFTTFGAPRPLTSPWMRPRRSVSFLACYNMPLWTSASIIILRNQSRRVAGSRGTF